jgi:biofilm PGA synthesis N-glycosyltransferase PgaC
MTISNELCRQYLFIALIATAAVHLCYYLFIFSRLAFYKSKEKENKKDPVSVIICAKNEVKNLRKFLPVVLDQHYPNYEVIVVNDCSWDETEEYLKEIKPQYPHLIVSTIREQDKYRHGKKFALTLGIKAAKSEILLMTDADCMPAGKNWISLMISAYKPDTEIVLGYGGYIREKGLLNSLIRFDTFQVAVQYLSFALSRNAYMGVGRNLCYRKSIFFKSKGFANHYHLFSGDDDLFVKENANARNTRIEINKEAFTYSEAKHTFGEWFKQKARHGTTANYYKSNHKILLSLFTLSNIATYILLITLLVTRYKWQFVLGIYLAKLLVQWSMSFMTANKLGEKSLMWFYPLYEMTYSVFLQPIFYISSLFTKQRAWK